MDLYTSEVSHNLMSHKEDGVIMCFGCAEAARMSQS